MKRKPAALSTCAFCSYRWPPMKPADVPPSLVCPVCGTRIDIGTAPHLKAVPGDPGAAHGDPGGAEPE